MRISKSHNPVFRGVRPEHGVSAESGETPRDMGLNKEDALKLVRHIRRYPGEELPVVPLISGKEEADSATVNKSELTPNLAQIGRLTSSRLDAYCSVQNKINHKYKLPFCAGWRP